MGEYNDWETVGIKFKKGKVFHIPCRCRCGREQDVNYYNLINGKSRSCRACALRERNRLSSEAMIGTIYGKWTVIDNDLDTPTNIWCECSCGAVHSVQKYDLEHQASTQCKSCGVTKHGLSRTGIYISWAAMVGRMTKTAKHYKVDTASMLHCEAWRQFDNFNSDMNNKWFESAQLHRKDNSKVIIKIIVYG